MLEPILELKNVKTHFAVQRGFLRTRAADTVKAVDGVSMTIERGEVMGIVGESGCGKSTLARTILQLVRATEGAIVLEGRNLSAATAAEMMTARQQLQMVFSGSLCIPESTHDRLRYAGRAMLVHRVCPPDAVPAEVAALMRRVGLAPRYLQKISA